MSAPAVTLRPYEPADEDAAIELWRRTWQTAYPSIDFSARLAWWRERWRAELVPAAKITIAESADAMVGFVTVDDEGYLDQIVVTPEAWGSGAADALIDAAKRIAPAGLSLHVNADNGRAIRFYERHGFAVAGRGANSMSNRPVLLMRWPARADKHSFDIS